MLDQDGKVISQSDIMEANYHKVNDWWSSKKEAFEKEMESRCRGTCSYRYLGFNPSMGAHQYQVGNLVLGLFVSHEGLEYDVVGQLF